MMPKSWGAMVVLFSVAILAPGSALANKRYCPAAIDPPTCLQASVSALLEAIDSCPLPDTDVKTSQTCINKALKVSKVQVKACGKQLCPHGTICVSGTSCGVEP